MRIDPFYLIRERMAVKVKMRTEKHGEEDVSAYDVMLAGSFANAILLKLDPELRPALYAMEQGDLIDTTAFHTLKFDLLGPLSWGLEMGRMVLELHDEDDERNNLVLTGRDVDKFNFELLPGGTVKLGLRVKLGVMDDEDNLLKLLRAANQQLLVSLHQAEIEEPGDNFDQAERITQEPHSEARKEAENLFNAPPAVTPETVVLAESWTNPPEVEKKTKPRKAPEPILEVAPE